LLIFYLAQCCLQYRQPNDSWFAERGSKMCATPSKDGQDQVWRTSYTPYFYLSIMKIYGKKIKGIGTLISLSTIASPQGGGFPCSNPTLSPPCLLARSFRKRRNRRCNLLLKAPKLHQCLGNPARGTEPSPPATPASG